MAAVYKDRWQVELFFKAVETVEEKVGALVRSVYGRSSGSVHVSQDEQEVVAVKYYVEAVLADLLEVRE